MTFQLQPGDYIRTALVPDDKKQAVIDAFVKAGDELSGDVDKLFDYDCVGWWYLVHDGCARISATNTNNMQGFHREVTLDQILGKPMLIEALKPGMRAKTLTGIVCQHENGVTRWEKSNAPCNAAMLTTTDYEIIPADPVPWVPSDGDTGWVVGPSYGTHPQTYVGNDAFRTREGAEQAAKIMKVVNAICNMHGAFDCGDHAGPYIQSANSGNGVLVTAFIPFGGEEAGDFSSHAVKYANNMIRGM